MRFKLTKELEENLRTLHALAISQSLEATRETHDALRAFEDNPTEERAKRLDQAHARSQRADTMLAAVGFAIDPILPEFVRSSEMTGHDAELTALCEANALIGTMQHQYGWPNKSHVTLA